VIPIGEWEVRGRRALVCLLLSTVVSDLTESSVFMPVPSAANRPKVVARVVALYGPLLGAQFFSSVILRKMTSRKVVAAKAEVSSFLPSPSKADPFRIRPLSFSN
jgi:hypothetical protein